MQTFRLHWPDHFGEARNSALQRLDDRWVLFLDADEWLERTIPRSLLDGLDTGQVHAPRIHEAERSVEMRGIPRLVYTSAGISYTRRVHEYCVRRQDVAQLTSDVAPRIVDIHIGHDGYRQGPELTKKQQRNVRLGLLDLAEKPGDLRTLHFLVRDSFDTATFDWAAATLRSMSSTGTGHDYSANGYPGHWYVAKTFPLAVHMGLREGRVDDVLSLVRGFATDAPSQADVIYYDLMVRSLVGKTALKDLEDLMGFRADNPSTGPSSLAEDGRHLDAAIVHLLRIHHHEASAKKYRAECQPWTDGFFVDSWPRDDVVAS